MFSVCFFFPNIFLKYSWTIKQKVVLMHVHFVSTTPKSAQTKGVEAILHSHYPPISQYVSYFNIYFATNSHSVIKITSNEVCSLTVMRFVIWALVRYVNTYLLLAHVLFKSNYVIKWSSFLLLHISLELLKTLLHNRIAA